MCYCDGMNKDRSNEVLYFNASQTLAGVSKPRALTEVRRQIREIAGGLGYTAVFGCQESPEQPNVGLVEEIWRLVDIPLQRT